MLDEAEKQCKCNGNNTEGRQLCTFFTVSCLMTTLIDLSLSLSLSVSLCLPLLPVFLQHKLFFCILAFHLKTPALVLLHASPPILTNLYHKKMCTLNCTFFCGSCFFRVLLHNCFSLFVPKNSKFP